MRNTLRLRTCPLLVVLSAALVGCGDGITGPGLDTPEGSFAVLMNEHRESVGCPALNWVPGLAEVARAHSADMVARGFFAHTNPDGLSPFDRMSAAGIEYSRAAENIAYGYGTAEAVLQGWLNSPPHRASIENCQLTEHGVGKVDSYWTHLFRTP